MGGYKDIDGFIDTDGYIDTDEENYTYWWDNYDGDIEEEKRKIEELVSKIEDPEERLDRYEDLLNDLEYDEYFAHNLHFKCESYLINMRMCLKPGKDEDINEFIGRILCYANMTHTPWPCAQNILIMNHNKKFTFLNNVKIDALNKINWDRILEKGKTKLRREYLHTWEEGKDDQEYKFEVVFVELCR